MDSASPLLCSPPRNLNPCFLKQQPSIPKNFMWPQRDLVHAHDELKEPLIDLGGFLRGDPAATRAAAALVREAGSTHGFFQVTNHGVDPRLIAAAHAHVDAFFKLPLSRKLAARKKSGSLWGYSGAHADRFSSRLPWKETLSFGFHQDNDVSVVAFFESTLGKDFQQAGVVYQRYCEAMNELGLAIMELLAISLGVERGHYREFFEDSESIMRCNNYPPCQEPGFAFGTGPHCDPTSLTILHQDEVGGLEVFANDKWRSVRPRDDAFVINIGDTFMALTNGVYKSCLHRAVVKREKERRSLAFFLCPRFDKVVAPPRELLCGPSGGIRSRVYPDFTWSDFLRFTQQSYRADAATLQNFTTWLLNNPSPN